jgi:hypothetical protein
MKRVVMAIGCGGIFLTMAAVSLLLVQTAPPVAAHAEGRQDKVYVPQRGFEVDVLIDGQRREEFYARGKTYIEAVPGREYEIRVTNPLPYRVAVAVAVDGLNSIDARHTSAWNASKWVLAPYQTIYLQGWQMSSNRARKFYFTSERDSYASKLGQTANIGVISAVFFREATPYPVRVMPPPRPRYDPDGTFKDKSSNSPSAGAESRGTERQQRDAVVSAPDDDYAATGIGRSVRNDVQWVNMELERNPAAEVTIRYEYYSALVRLGVLPRHYPQPDPLRRREESRGFEDRRFSPEP